MLPNLPKALPTVWKFHTNQLYMLHFELPNGKITKYSYNALGKCSVKVKPDGYDPYHLVRVERYNSEGVLTYACDCPFYDFTRNRLQVDSPAGSVNYAFYEKNRKVKINSKGWALYQHAFDPVENVLSLTLKDP